MQRLCFIPCLLLLAIALPRDACAQSSVVDTVRVGDAVVDGSFIKPYTVTWQSTQTSPEGTTQPGNTVKETVEFVEGRDGADLLKFAQAWYNPESTLLYINTQVADPKTLTQKKFHSLAPQGGIGHLDFDGLRIHGAAAYAPESEHVVFDIELTEPLFADGLAGLFVAAFPLDEGYEAVAPGFGWGGSCSEPCLSWMQFRVVGREQVEVKNHGPMDTWVVEVGPQPGSGLRYWVTQEAPYFVKAIARSGNGGTNTFEILNWALLNE